MKRPRAGTAEEDSVPERQLRECVAEPPKCHQSKELCESSAVSFTAPFMATIKLQSPVLLETTLKLVVSGYRTGSSWITNNGGGNSGVGMNPVFMESREPGLSFQTAETVGILCKVKCCEISNNQHSYFSWSCLKTRWERFLREHS